jgi:Flp pilus assembly protein TadG
MRRKIRYGYFRKTCLRESAGGAPAQAGALAVTGRRTAGFTVCQAGTTAVEFALILPALAALLVGGLYTALMIYSAAGLHSAVEEAARCYSVNANVCGSSAAAQTYAQSRYFGIDTPTFTATQTACGHQVNATLNIAFSAVVTEVKVPLSATACFP